MNWYENSSLNASDSVGNGSDKLFYGKEPLNITATPRHFLIGVGAEQSKTQLCATIAARDLFVNDNDQQVRAPVDIVVAMDVSASMRGDKLALCKVSLEMIINSLLPGDRFGLVTFSDTAEVEIPVQELSADQKETAVELIKSLEPRRKTNISAAVCLAAQELRKVQSPNPVRAIFLLTDGLANEGRTKVFDLVNLTRACCEDESHVSDTTTFVHNEVREMPPEEQVEPPTRPPPITIHCFGYGSNHSSKMLQEISLATLGGSYYFVEQDSQVLTAFGDALGGVFSVVAQDAVLTITVPEESRDLGVEIVKVHHDSKVAHKGGSFTVSLGDFYAEESRDVLFEVTLANPSITAVDYWITHAVVSISYTDTLSGAFVESKPVPCDIARSSGKAVSKASQRVKVQWLRVRVTETIRQADMFATKGNVQEARVFVETMLDSIEMLADDIRLDPLVKQLAHDLNRCKNGLLSHDAYVTFGTHIMRNTSQSHGTQRCMNSFGGSNVYRGTLKARTIFKFQNR